MSTMGRACWERCRPRPPETRIRVSVRLERGAWRRGMWRLIEAIFGIGRMETSSSGASDMKARTWWGVLKDFDCGSC